MAKNTPPSNARTGTRRPSSSKGGGGRTVFYGVLVAIVVIGIGAILYLAKRPATASASNQSAEFEAYKARYANAGPPQPHTLGNPNAPVVIEEFADFECPSCGRFATITEPDVRKQVVDAGQAFYKYYDYPLPMHKNSQAASNAAACAEEQGKFWEMHDQLFAGQDQWGLGPGETEVTDDPKSVFAGYAKAIGLNVPQWSQCFDAHKYQARIDANTAEALRRNVNETPTFFFNGKIAVGAQTFDDVQRLVNEAKTAGAAKPAAESANQKATVPRGGVADTTKH